jgi:hypothetical protein
VTIRWTASRSSVRMRATVPCLPWLARLHGVDQFRHTTNSPRTPAIRYTAVDQGLP